MLLKFFFDLIGGVLKCLFYKDLLCNIFIWIFYFVKFLFKFFKYFFIEMVFFYKVEVIYVNILYEFFVKYVFFK